MNKRTTPHTMLRRAAVLLAVASFSVASPVAVSAAPLAQIDTAATASVDGSHTTDDVTLELAQSEATETDTDSSDEKESTPSGIASLALIIAVTALIMSGLAVVISLRRPNPAREDAA